MSGSSSLPLTAAHAQRGAALVTALLLLVVMTILAVTAMQMSRVQEKLTGNTRDMNVAFEAAEAASRNGEARINQLVYPLQFCSVAPCQLYDSGTLTDIENQPKSWWTATGAPFADGSGNPMSGVAENPQYIIQYIRLARTDGDVELGVPSVGRDFFQVTSHSSGASGLANVVVQTTFARK